MIQILMKTSSHRQSSTTILTRRFFGIVEGKVKVWATHFRFLNDSDEVAFGADIVARAIEQLHTEISAVGIDVTALVERMKKLATEDCFFTCLSERHDVLSQWREYANNAAGYCIAVRPEERLLGYGDTDRYVSNQLVKCLYGEAAVRDWLDKGLRRKIEIAGRRPNLDSKSDWLTSELMRVARRCLHRAKHEHFREECEWRIVVDAPPDTVNFRAGALGLTPYLVTEPMTLEEVWIGPRIGPDAEAAKRTVERFLGHHNLDATVRYWASPFQR
jgi:hypothetical protein